MFSAAISQDPIPANAVGEVAGYLLEHDAQNADLVCIFTTRHHLGAIEDIAGAFKTLLNPSTLIGCAAQAVIGPRCEVESIPAISAWAGNVGPLHPLRLDLVDHPSGNKALAGWPSDLGWQPSYGVMIADPFSFPAPVFFDALNESIGFFPILGGFASAGLNPGGNRLILDGEIFDSGAVGAVIGPQADLGFDTAVAQGCRPIGAPYVVTRAQDNVIYDLAGESAYSRLITTIEKEFSGDYADTRRALLLGCVIDEHQIDFGTGDFLIRTILDANPLTGALIIGEKIEVGTTVQFHVLDANVAKAELNHLLQSKSANGALLFSCTGRGTEMFGRSNYDATAIADLLEDPPTAGFVASGEFGPIGNRNFVHGFTASALLMKKFQ